MSHLNKKKKIKRICFVNQHQFDSLTSMTLHNVGYRLDMWRERVRVCVPKPCAITCYGCLVGTLMLPRILYLPELSRFFFKYRKCNLKELW